METSDYFLVIERMIRNGDVSSDQLRDLLAYLEEQGHISVTEHENLLELAEVLKTDQTS